MPLGRLASVLAALCMAALWTAQAAKAQEQLTPDEFLDRATGRTLTFEYFPNGGVVGIEQFLSRSRTVWATPTGTCTYGRIELRGTQICFIYEDLPDPEHCWVPFDSDEGMVVFAGTESIQRVSRITDNPVVCEDPAIS